MLPLDRNVADLVAMTGAGVGLVGLLLAVLAHLRLRRVRLSFAVFTGPHGPETVLDALDRQRQEVERLRAELSAVHGQLDATRADVGDAIRHVSVVRYDAFGDMGGRLSFSAALLDDAGDGLVVTAINGRSETRSYAKGVKAGQSEHSLSPEEQQAIGLALGGGRTSSRRAPARA